MTDQSTRTNYTKGLRALADLLDNNPAIPIPYSLDKSSGLTWYVHDSIETVLAIRKLMEDPITLPNESHNFPVQITGTLAGFAATVDVARAIALASGVANPPPAMNPRLLAAEPVPA